MPRSRIPWICSIVLFNLQPYLNQFETTDVGSFLGNFTVNEKINKKNLCIYQRCFDQLDIVSSSIIYSTFDQFTNQFINQAGGAYCPLKPYDVILQLQEINPPQVFLIFTPSFPPMSPRRNIVTLDQLVKYSTTSDIIYYIVNGICGYLSKL